MLLHATEMPELQRLLEPGAPCPAHPHSSIGSGRLQLRLLGERGVSWMEGCTAHTPGPRRPTLQMTTFQGGRTEGGAVTPKESKILDASEIKAETHEGERFRQLIRGHRGLHVPHYVCCKSLCC